MKIGEKEARVTVSVPYKGTASQATLGATACVTA